MKTLFINGTWREGSSFEESISPNTGSVIGRFAVADSEDVNLAVRSATAASEHWMSTPVAERARVIGRFADLLTDAYGAPGEPTPLKELICQEVGKRLAEADIEVAESADMVRFFAETAPGLLKPKELELDTALWPTKRSTVVRKPFGVVAAIKPWNYPLELPLWSVASALVAGNCVIFKASEHSPLVAVRMVEMLLEAGLPPNVIQLLTGGRITGEHLVDHDGLDFLTFTGSLNTGMSIARKLAETLTPHTLELGGVDAAIVFDDADLDLAINGLVWGSFTNGGQVCVRPKRVFVHEKVYDAFIAGTLKAVDALRVGVDIGPLISLQAVQGVAAMVGDSVGGGAKLMAGGDRVEHEGGFYFAPTVLTEIPEAALLARKECFGPVMCVWRFEDLDEAISRANNVDAGLGGSVWTRDLEKARMVMGRLKVGMCWHNDVNVAFPQAPWGGRNRSGHGVELGEEGILEFAPPQHLSFETSSDKTRDWWFPY